MWAAKLVFRFSNGSRFIDGATAHSARSGSNMGVLMTIRSGFQYLSIAASASLMAACAGGGEADEATEEEAPEEEEVALADPCPDRVQDRRGTTDPLTCSCTPEAAEDGNVWGAGPYSDDSAVCRAAMHAGLVGDEPANVTVNFLPGRESYTANTANGVETSRWGRWNGSFHFEGAPTGEPEEMAAKEELEACPTSAGALRGSGRTVECSCTAEAASSGSVWGSGPYTDDSRVCRAAVHAGQIGPDGGDVQFEVVSGEQSYEGSTANGVESRDYGAWGGAIDFPDGDAL